MGKRLEKVLSPLAGTNRTNLSDRQEQVVKSSCLDSNNSPVSLSNLTEDDIYVERQMMSREELRIWNK